jgi:hypothetical protein
MQMYSKFFKTSFLRVKNLLLLTNVDDLVKTGILSMVSEIASAGFCEILKLFCA